MHNLTAATTQIRIHKEWENEGDTTLNKTKMHICIHVNSRTRNLKTVISALFYVHTNLIISLTQKYLKWPAMV